MEKRTIKFIKRHEVKADGGPVYLDGQIEPMTVDACEHFVRRGSAVYYTADMEKADKAAAKAEAAAKKAGKEADAKKEAEK